MPFFHLPSDSMKRTFSTFSPLCAKDIYRPNVCTMYDSVGNGLCHVCPFRLFIYLFIITHVIFQRIWNLVFVRRSMFFYLAAAIQICMEPNGTNQINSPTNQLQNKWKLGFSFAFPFFSSNLYCRWVLWHGTEEEKNPIPKLFITGSRKFSNLFHNESLKISFDVYIRLSLHAPHRNVTFLLFCAQFHSQRHFTTRNYEVVTEKNGIKSFMELVCTRFFRSFNTM